MPQSKLTIPLRFTPDQAAVIESFAERHPGGLHAEIVTDDAGATELAEIWRHDRTSPLFTLTPLPGGAVEIYDLVGEIYEVDTIGSALIRLQTYASGRGSDLLRNVA